MEAPLQRISSQRFKVVPIGPSPLRCSAGSQRENLWVSRRKRHPGCLGGDAMSPTIGGQAVTRHPRVPLTIIPEPDAHVERLIETTKSPGTRWRGPWNARRVTGPPAIPRASLLTSLLLFTSTSGIDAKSHPSDRIKSPARKSRVRSFTFRNTNFHARNRQNIVRGRCNMELKRFLTFYLSVFMICLQSSRNKSFLVVSRRPSPCFYS